MTAVSQFEFAIPMVAFITVVQTPSSYTPVYRAAFDTCAPPGSNEVRAEELAFFRSGNMDEALSCHTVALFL